jgi:pSer/pThr/pTyr-binding forkhead associated (FHA) protein
MARTASLIEVRNGTMFRSDDRGSIIGRGLDSMSPSSEPYINLSQACAPGEAEDLGVSRRHAEIARLANGYSIRDLASTNGTRLKRAGQASWATLQPREWTLLQEGDILQFGLLEVAVSLSR